MKTRNTLVLLSLVLSVGGMISCKKTNETKFVEKWVVKEFRNVETEPYMGFGNFSEVTETNGDLYTKSGTYSGVPLPDGTEDPNYSYNIALTSHTFRIRRNGEWECVLEYGIEDTSGTEIEKSSVTQTNAGSWSFLGNVDTFEKNERVVFNTTLKNYVEHYEVYNNGELVDSVTLYSLETYIDGEKPMVFRIVESKYGYLELLEEKNETHLYSDDNSSYVYEESGLVSYKLEKD